jgi:hypothetical protein
MRCPDSIHNPVTTFFTVGNERPDANDGVVDVLGELVPQFGSDLVIRLAKVAVRGSEALQVGDRFKVPYDNIAHVARNTTWA